MTETVLQVNHLQTSFFTEKGVAKVLDGVSFFIRPGEILGLVGETGSGKSVTGFSLLNLVKRPGRVVGGEVWLKGRNVLTLSEKQLAEEVRGSEISMIFQNPRASINPLFTVGDLLVQVLRTHRPMSRSMAKEEALRLLQAVHIPDAKQHMKSYAHHLSGGMAQRIMIALAISCNPQVLIADEPTTGLDVTTQAQILELLRELNERNQSAQLFVTHDLGVASKHCHRIAVMYAGNIVEEGATKEILHNPLHPYTRGLVASRPQKNRHAFLTSIPGSVPNPHDPPSGCRFHTRCPWSTAQCKAEKPVLADVGMTKVACWNWEEAQREDVSRFGS